MLHARAKLDNHQPTKETRQLEGFFLYRQPDQTPSSNLEIIAEIIGVLIGLKPASKQDFTLTSIALRNLQTIIADLGLFSLVEQVSLPSTPPQHFAYDIFISKRPDTAQELRNTMRAWIALGYCPDNPKDQALTVKIGQLLGYPKTAIQHVAFGPRDASGNPYHHPGSDRDRYYVHSFDHYVSEYRLFEDQLHSALTKICPTTAEIMKQDTSRNWSSRNFRPKR